MEQLAKAGREGEKKDHLPRKEKKGGGLGLAATSESSEG
jgi:hypothetical protein